MYINCAWIPTHGLLQHNLLEVQVPHSSPPGLNENNSKSFLNFFLFSCIIFSSNNVILRV